MYAYIYVLTSIDIITVHNKAVQYYLLGISTPEVYGNEKSFEYVHMAIITKTQYTIIRTYI